MPYQIPIPPMFNGGLRAGHLLLDSFPAQAKVRIANSTVSPSDDINDLTSGTGDFEFIPDPSANAFGHVENHHDNDGREEDHSDFRKNDQ